MVHQFRTPDVWGITDNEIEQVEFTEDDSLDLSNLLHGEQPEDTETEDEEQQEDE